MRRRSPPFFLLALAALGALPLAVAWGDPRPAPTGPADTPAVDVPAADSFAAVPVLLTDAATEAHVRRAVEAILAEADLPPALWGIYVRDLETGRTVYSRNAEQLLIPASTLKLFTTATALDALGPEHRYATRLYFDGDTRDDGTLRGDLVVRGSGDPTFGSRYAPDSADGDPFETWARQLAAAGIRRIEGRLIGDDDVFEDYPYGEGWDVTHVATESYAPSAGGLGWADNLATVEIAGAGAGEPAVVTTDPAGYVEVRNRVETRSGTGGQPFRVLRALGTNTLALSGSVSTRYRGRLLVPIENPTRYALHAFRLALQAAGIQVAAPPADADDLDRPLDYDDLGEPLLVHVSPPLAEIVRRINRRSDNFYAEQVFRTLSADGSAAGGARRVFAFLEASGVGPEALSIKDGSGLSRKDLVTALAMVGVLDRMHRHPARAAFVESRAEGGAARSTLSRRLADVPVRAKTGSLDYVRALAGYVTGPNGHRLAFSVIANNYTDGGGRIASATDRIVQALATGERVEE